MLTVGFVNFINAIPLFYLFILKQKACPFKIILENPKTLTSLLINNKLDACLTSSSSFLHHQLTSFGDIGIIGSKQILSVNLYLKEPLFHSQLPIGLPNDSQTSILLLKILCFHHFKIKPSFELINKPLQNYNEFLLIGDIALKNQTFKTYKTLDLITLWDNMTNLPFIFANLFCNKNLNVKNQNIILEAIHESILYSQLNIDKVIQYAHKQSGINKDIISSYYKKIIYTISEKSLKGLYLFQEYCKNLSY